uniref:Uncharacterized protein n=1 Tax=Arundo donax TaxID=35708 RepID=A0A0A9CZ92_ARUDO
MHSIFYYALQFLINGRKQSTLLFTFFCKIKINFVSFCHIRMKSSISYSVVPVDQKAMLKPYALSEIQTQALGRVSPMFCSKQGKLLTQLSENGISKLEIAF